MVSPHPAVSWHPCRCFYVNCSIVMRQFGKIQKLHCHFLPGFPLWHLLAFITPWNSFSLVTSYSLNSTYMTNSFSVLFMGSYSIALLPLKCCSSPNFTLDLLFSLYSFNVCSSLCSWFQLSSAYTDDFPNCLPIPPGTPVRLYTQLSVGCFHIARSTSDQYLKHCSCYLTLNTPVLSILVGGTIWYPVTPARNVTGVFDPSPHSASSLPITSSAHFVS